MASPRLAPDRVAESAHGFPGEGLGTGDNSTLPMAATAWISRKVPARNASLARSTSGDGEGRSCTAIAAGSARREIESRMPSAVRRQRRSDVVDCGAMEHIWFALALTLLAGLATGIGSVLAFTAKRTNYRFLSMATGFSAGVMIYVSFVEILPQALAALTGEYGHSHGSWATVAAFFGGIVFIGLIDTLIPATENPHEAHSETEMAPLHDTSAPIPDYRLPGCGDTTVAGLRAHENDAGRRHLLRLGLFTALAITIHNIPEGLATFFSALQNPAVGLAIAVAVAIHNIPEGVSVSVPIYYATGNRTKAFVYSLLSGFAEFVGAVVAFGLLLLLLGQDGAAVPWHVVGILLAGVAGIMVYISLDELLPTSRAYGRGHDSILGLVAGMAVMALSLLLMQ